MDNHQELREMIIDEIVFQKKLFYQKDSEKNKLKEELSGLTDYSLVLELFRTGVRQAQEILENPYGY